jgi:hypothetical protein
VATDVTKGLNGTGGKSGQPGVYPAPLPEGNIQKTKKKLTPRQMQENIKWRLGFYTQAK